MNPWEAMPEDIAQDLAHLLEQLAAEIEQATHPHNGQLSQAPVRLLVTRAAIEGYEIGRRAAEARP